MSSRLALSQETTHVRRRGQNPPTHTHQSVILCLSFLLSFVKTTAAAAGFHYVIYIGPELVILPQPSEYGGYR